MSTLPHTGRFDSFGDRLKAHLSIARFDHVSKNVFVLPGILVAYRAIGGRIEPGRLIRNIVLGMIACTLVACSNYVVNEILDAAYDKFHPTKKYRPVPSGRVSIPIAYAQWIVMMLLGLLVAYQVSGMFLATCLSLWIMGCVYNIKPLRTKEVPYLDILSESINNPIRMLMGWYMVTDQILPPSTLLVAYWMIGAYFMGLKRFGEYRQIGDPALAATYRRSFKHYSERTLLVSVMFYGSTAMLFFGAFIARYRLELILAFPLIAWVMAVYLMISFEDDSAVQNPEYLHREARLMIPVLLCAALLSTLMFVRVPALHNFFVRSNFEDVIEKVP
jgi:decaprenyl-phosphate phosphoribosyltransferase